MYDLENYSLNKHRGQYICYCFLCNPDIEMEPQNKLPKGAHKPNHKVLIVQEA